MGWKVSTSATANFVLVALEQAIHAPGSGLEDGLIHNSDRGTQYFAVTYTQRKAEANLAASVGSVGDSYDNAPAETINGFTGHYLSARAAERLVAAPAARQMLAHLFGSSSADEAD